MGSPLESVESIGVWALRDINVLGFDVVDVRGVQALGCALHVSVVRVGLDH